MDTEATSTTGRCRGHDRRIVDRERRGDTLTRKCRTSREADVHQQGWPLRNRTDNRLGGDGSPKAGKRLRALRRELRRLRRRLLWPEQQVLRRERLSERHLRVRQLARELQRVLERVAPPRRLLWRLRELRFQLQRAELPTELLPPPAVDQRLVQRLRDARPMPTLVLRLRPKTRWRRT